MSALETAFEAIPQLIQSSAANMDAMLTAMDTKFTLTVYQLRREQYSPGGVASSSGPPPLDPGPVVPPSINSDDDDFRSLETPRYPRRDHFDGRGFTPRTPWQQWLDFPHFSDGEDPSSSIYKA